jgi:hypothetical protein
LSSTVSEANAEAPPSEVLDAAVELADDPAADTEDAAPARSAATTLRVQSHKQPAVEKKAEAAAAPETKAEPAEMDVVESFGTPNIEYDAFHSDSVGGSNMVEYKSWHTALDQVGVPDAERALADWHIWTWVYKHDDSYEVYYDGHQVQHGTLHWTHGGDASGEPIDMRFLFDFSWGHTQVSDVNIELPASMFPLTYEIDYSRVYLR